MGQGISRGTGTNSNNIQHIAYIVNEREFEQQWLRITAWLTPTYKYHIVDVSPPLDGTIRRTILVNKIHSTSSFLVGFRNSVRNCTGRSMGNAISMGPPTRTE